MDILVTGSISFDEILNFPGKFVDHFHPEKLHQINVSFVVDNLEKQLGGTATNIAYNASRALKFLGNKKIKVKLLSSVGKDGKAHLDFFAKNDIDTKGLLQDKKMYSAFGSVITDNKDNQIWGFYYGACELAKEIELKIHVKKDSILVISANHPKAFMNFQKSAIKNKVGYLYDPGMSLTWIKDKDLLEGVLKSKYFVGNDYEIAMITKRIGMSVSDLIKKNVNVITTLGEQGVRYQSKIENIIVPGYKVKKVIDPTGAGDAWRGGFITAITSGWKTRDALKLGNVMASFTVEKYGTITHAPTNSTIEKRFKSV